MLQVSSTADTPFSGIEEISIQNKTRLCLNYLNVDFNQNTNLAVTKLKKIGSCSL